MIVFGKNANKLTKRRYKIAIIAPNCFYYQVDLYKSLAIHPRIDLTVYFCSDEGLTNKDVMKMYNSDGDWGHDDTLLEGYNCKFLHNFSPRPSYLNSLVGLMNWGLWNELRRLQPDGIVLMSWMNPTWWLAVLIAICGRIPFMLMTDANVHTERDMNPLKKLVRKFILGKILFTYCAGFLCAGVQNRDLYKAYNVADSKLFEFAYSSGYQKLLDKGSELKLEKNMLREEMGIEQDAFVVLYCGRLSQEKNPLQLLKSYQLLKHPKKTLIYVGDGELMDSLVSYVEENKVESVKFMGFQNRNHIGKFYVVSDLLVLPSLRETWGMVVNEALCFGLPVVVSDAVGSLYDMVQEGKNGFSYPAGDEAELGLILNKIADMGIDDRLSMGECSLDIITSWVNRDLGRVIPEVLDHAYSGGDGD